MPGGAGPWGKVSMPGDEHPDEPGPGPSQPDRELFDRMLQERVAKVLTQRTWLEAGIEDMRAARSLTFTDDEHDPEGSTVSLDQARDAALLSRTERALAELLAARERLLAGGFGRCEQCGADIPRERLLVRPEARLCVPCAEHLLHR